MEGESGLSETEMNPDGDDPRYPVAQAQERSEHEL